MAKLVSQTYGEALYEACMESGEDKVVQLADEIRCVNEILEHNPQFHELMVHPGISKQDKLQIVDSVFKGRVDETLTGLLEVVVSKERYRDLPDIFEYFIHRVKEQRKIGTAYVITAVELSEQQKAAVHEKLLATAGYREVEMFYEVDASIIGGMIIRINDRVVDSSIRTKLNGLTKQLLQIQLG